MYRPIIRSYAGFIVYRLIVFVFDYLCIIYSCSYISEYIQCYLRGYIEELPILSDTKVGKSVYCLMDNFLYFIVFCSFDRSKYFKGQWYGCIIELL